VGRPEENGHLEDIGVFGKISIEVVNIKKWDGEAKRQVVGCC
jgi:hypothetical protein